MAANPTPVDYDANQGLDIASPVPKKSPATSERLKNARFCPSGSITKRAGRKYVTDTAGGLGVGAWTRESGGEDESIPVSVAANLFATRSGTFVVTFSGTASSVYLVNLCDETSFTWKLVIYQDSVAVCECDLGVGVDELSTVTLADLKTDIEAISADWAVTITGDSGLPAAFLPAITNGGFEGTPLEYSIPFEYQEQVRQPHNGPDPFANHNTNRNDDGFRPASFLNHHNVLLIATRDDYLRKWDGQAVFRAGMPACVITSATPAGSASFSGSFNYIARYAHYDAQGNYVPGALSPLKSAVPASASRVDVAIPTIQDTSGFQTDYAKVNGLQAAVTNIVVDSGHHLVAGDIVTIYNTATLSVEIREVQSVDATHVVVDTAVSVADNSIISAGLVIEIYRTQDTGSLFYYVTTLVNDPSVSSLTYADSAVDASLGALFTLPRRVLEAPPKGGIIVEWQNTPVMSRHPDYPTRITYAEPDYPEAFPEATNSFDLWSHSGGGITALCPNMVGLDVFFLKSLYRVLGSIAEDTFERRLTSAATGCLNQQCVVSLDNGLILWLSLLGPRAMTPGGTPTQVGIPIDSLFKDSRPIGSEWALRRAYVVDMPLDSMVMFYLPTETDQSGDVAEGDFSEAYVLDYYLESPRWVGPWTNLNAAGGAATVNDRLYFVERRYSAVSGNVETYMQKLQRRNDEFELVDHTEQIDFDWAPGWESAGSKTLRKIFSWFRIYSNDAQRSAAFSIDVRFEKDFVPYVGKEIRVSIGTGGANVGWYFGPWGGFSWGAPASPSLDIPIPDNGAFALRPVFRHSRIYERPLISLYSLAIKSPYAEGLAR